ncbi:MAG: hypothetical protein KDA63_01250, partial [Planctomycetales bacterium]|nr:hypothetical protein [Planctomycetales bacterium]
MFDALELDRQPPSEELRHFTNRESEQAVFRRILEVAANDTLPVLMFYGIGGTGKSWLLRRFRHTAESLKLPVAHLDLDNRSGAGIGRRDTAGILAEIRGQLGPSLRCPRLDLAYAWLRAKLRDAEDPAFRGGTALGVAAEFVAELGKVATSDVPGGNLIGWVAKKVTAPRFKKLKTSGLADWLASKNGEADFLRLKVRTADELREELPKRLLLDLRDSLPQRGDFRCRGVLLLDAMESLIRTTSASHAQYEAQKWVRELYHPDSPLLVVIAGRDRLNWAQMPNSAFAAPEHLEQHLIGGLAQPDAEQFLVNCGITNSELQRAILGV